MPNSQLQISVVDGQNRVQLHHRSDLFVCCTNEVDFSFRDAIGFPSASFDQQNIAATYKHSGSK